MNKKRVALLSLLGLVTTGVVLSPAITFAAFVSAKDINQDVYVKRTIYLDAVSTSLWGESNSAHNRYAVWVWGTNNEGSWANSESFMEHHDSLVYKAVLPSTAEYAIFVKLEYHEDIVFPSWDDKVSQTADLTLSSTWDKYTITSKGDVDHNATGSQSLAYNS